MKRCKEEELEDVMKHDAELDVEGAHAINQEKETDASDALGSADGVKVIGECNHTGSMVTSVKVPLRQQGLTGTPLSGQDMKIGLLMSYSQNTAHATLSYLQNRFGQFANVPHTWVANTKRHVWHRMPAIESHL